MVIDMELDRIWFGYVIKFLLRAMGIAQRMEHMLYLLEAPPLQGTQSTAEGYVTPKQQ